MHQYHIFPSVSCPKLFTGFYWNVVSRVFTTCSHFGIKLSTVSPTLYRSSNCSIQQSVKSSHCIKRIDTCYEWAETFTLSIIWYGEYSTECSGSNYACVA
jgi:hypothetical protein